MDDETTARPLLTGKTSDFLKIGVGAAGRGDLATLQAVLAVQPDWITRIGSHGRTMLWEAAYRGRLETAAHLVERGADIEARGCHFTPLLVEISPYCAARHRKHDAVAELLLAHGALTDILTHAYLGNGECVKTCLDDDPTLATAEVAQHDPNVRATVLHYAVAAGHLDIVRVLLARGATPAPYALWLTRFAIWRERADILQELIGAGMPVESPAVPRAGVLS
ncbi:MAG: ankyrin repeat domain-containing protein, partial [Gammaproteobacteria bacterium]|nr:ankyrin repeat domain-containing protein [Gammaproteobacteria bacterium]